MPIGEPAFEEMAIDFITDLPKSEAYHTTLVVPAWFTKVHYYILAKRISKVEDIAQSHIYDI